MHLRDLAHHPNHPERMKDIFVFVCSSLASIYMKPSISSLINAMLCLYANYHAI